MAVATPALVAGLPRQYFVDLVVAIESSFGVKLVGEDFVNVESLQDFYDLIEKKYNGGKANGYSKLLQTCQGK